jgi:hypothetical protein
MVVFSTPEAAIREGFTVIDFDREYDLYIVEKDVSRSGYRAKMLAFARRAVVRAV